MTWLAHWQSLERDLSDLIAALPPGLPEHGLTEATHYVEFSEYGLALEVLANIALEHPQRLSPPVLARFDDLTERMGMADEDLVRSLHTHPPSHDGPLAA